MGTLGWGGLKGRKGIIRCTHQNTVPAPLIFCFSIPHDSVVAFPGADTEESHACPLQVNYSLMSAQAAEANLKTAALTHLAMLLQLYILCHLKT